MLTVGGSAHPAFTDTMFGEEFFYDSHPPEVVLKLLATAGFQMVTGEFTSLPTGGRECVGQSHTRRSIWRKRSWKRTR